MPIETNNLIIYTPNKDESLTLMLLPAQTISAKWTLFQWGQK